MFKLALATTLGVTLNLMAVQSSYAANDWEGISPEEKKLLALKTYPDKGQKLYDKHCFKCHELESWGSPDGDFPELAGQHPSVLLKQLLDIRDHRRENPDMDDILEKKALTMPEGLANVVAYISTLPMSPDNGQGQGLDVSHGKKLYEQHCTTCHGKYGEGNADKAYPRLQAQHYNYMLRQFKAIKAGKRGNGHPIMTKLINEFDAEETKAVLDYVSRIKPPKEKDAAATHFDQIMDQFKINPVQ